MIIGLAGCSIHIIDIRHRYINKQRGHKFKDKYLIIPIQINFYPTNRAQQISKITSAMACALVYTNLKKDLT